MRASFHRPPQHPTYLAPLTTDTACKQHISRHDGYTLGMNSAQVCVLQQPNEIRLTRFLECQDRC